MSFTPIIIIKKKDLDAKIAILEDDLYSPDLEIYSVAKHLLEVSKNTSIKFDDLELLLCVYNETTSFNAAIRECLDRLEIEYVIDNN